MSLSRAFLGSLILVTAGLVTVCGEQARGEVVGLWSDTPIVVGADDPVFHQIFESAKTGTRRIAMFGDSQETTPGGFGFQYVPSLNSGFADFYGNVPETFLAGASSYEAWLTSGSTVGGTASTVDSKTLLPSMRQVTFGTSPFGLMSRVVVDGSNTPDVVASTMDTTRVTAELYARSRTGGSAEVNWRANVNATDQKSYFGGTNIATGQTNLSLNSSDGQFARETLGTFDLNGRNSLQIIAQGDSADGADLVGVRFKNADNPAGVAVHSFSAGGYRVSDLLDNHADAGEAFRVMGDWDAVAFHFGANDSAAVTFAEFEADLRDAITMVRDWSGNGELPIILFSDPDRIHANEPLRENYDRFPGVAAKLALELDQVMAVNSRRLAAEAGWQIGAPGVDDFLADGVHYTPLGAQTLASLEVNAILSATGVTAIPEPRTIGLAAGVMALWLCGHRRRSSNPACAAGR